MCFRAETMKHIKLRDTVKNDWPGLFKKTSMP